MKRKILFGLVVILSFTGCVHIDVTQEGFESYGAEIYQNFVYFVSRDVILRETVVPGVGDHVTQDDTGKVTLINREIHIESKKTRGRVLNATSDRFDVAFEELPGGIKPVLTFRLNPADKKKRYFIDTSTQEEVKLVDEKGEFGYISIKGYVISYNDKRHVIDSIDNINNAGEKIPYLVQKLDIKIINETRIVRGLR